MPLALPLYSNMFGFLPIYRASGTFDFETISGYSKSQSDDILVVERNTIDSKKSHRDDISEVNGI